MFALRPNNIKMFALRPNNNAGENIYMSSGSAAQDQAQGAVDSWWENLI